MSKFSISLNALFYLHLVLMLLITLPLIPFLFILQTTHFHVFSSVLISNIEFYAPNRDFRASSNQAFILRSETTGCRTCRVLKSRPG
jgi:hypothetical protein